MKAKRTNIKYGSVDLEVFMLPDGSYQLSQTQAGLALGKHDKSLREFLNGKSLEALPHKDFSGGEIEIETDNNLPVHIKAVPIKVVVAYWTYWANKGNTLAQALLGAGTEEAITRLCDSAFGETKSESEYQQQTASNIQQNEVLFQMMQMITNMNNKLEKQEEMNIALLAKTEKLNELTEAGNLHPGCYGILDSEVDDNTTTAITAYDYLKSQELEDWSRSKTFGKRSAAAMRIGKQVEKLQTYKGNVLYLPEDVPYLEQTLKQMLGLQ